MSARLYGRMNGWSSHAQVSKGFETALRGAGLLAGVYAVDESMEFDGEAPAGASARDAIFTGPPSLVHKLTQAAAHERRYAMLAPNSTVVSQPILEAYRSCCTHVLAPSLWASGVLEPMFKQPVLTAPHGVSERFTMIAERTDFGRRCPPREGFMVLHLSTSDRERKGTLLLLEAWEQLLKQKVLPAESTLALVLDPMPMRALENWLEAEERNLPPRVNLTRRFSGGRGGPPELMRSLYSAFHVVCQPSRGEAFGLVPLEALACGVPVVATSCTGHTEYLQGKSEADGVVVVPTGELAPLDDLPGAQAPSLTADAVARALEKAYLAWPELQAAARGRAARLRAAWSWEQQLAPLMRRLKE